MTLSKFVVRSGRSALCAGLALTAVNAFGQQATQDQTGQTESSAVLQEVTVTAERFAATVQSSPVAITAISAEALMERQVTNVLTAATEIPGVMITPAQGSNTSARIIMRGVGQSTAGINFDPAVGIYIDGVYQPRINGAFFEFFDLANMEVLRGPQGTLYGRNSSGGAIKLATLRPEFDWTGKAEIGAGNYDAWSAKGWLSGPITDKLAFSASGLMRKRDGYIYGVEYGRRIGNMDTRGERVKLLYTPTDRLEVELSAFALQDYSEAGVPVPLQVFPGINMPEANGTFNRDLTRTEIYGPFGAGSINNTGGALNIRFSVNDNLELASITGYGNQRTYSTGSTNFVSLAQQAQKDAGLNVTAPSTNEGTTRNEFWSQEFVATYSSEQFKGVVGLFYFDEEGQSRATTADSPTIDQDRLTEASAVFAQGTYTVGWGVGLTAGIRYTRETADFTQFYRQQLATPQSASKTFTATTPKFGVNWQATDDLLLYASYTQGFKSGGFNPIPPSSNTGTGQIGSPTPYNPEEVDSYEVGIKYTTPDRTMRFNLAAFRAEYDGMQLPVFFPGTSTIYTSNATGGIVKGIEFEPTWQVLDSLQLYGNASLNTGEYTGSFICANQYGAFIDCRDRDLVGLIPEKYQLGFRFSPMLPMPGELRINGSWNNHSDYFNNVANEGPLVRTVAASIYNAGLSWTSPQQRYNVTLDVRNIANKHYSLAGLQQTNAVRPAVSAFPNAPREYFLRFGTEF
ncbi:TonB-dependent receptor [Peristeroidobacter soli]|uniref:TonB-dependent receptor n=1 Tax=Peristeroidobacter soli TaxID=2497877 RepID=UPI00101D3938|nr:TonB-dependent receptor [Peristeroidobacter soli]